MFENLFTKVYMKFKLNTYKSMFEQIQNRETSLTLVETYCIEIIYAMNNPTISEFSSFVQISSPNAAYKINSLIKKGYLKKVQSQNDKREYHLVVTDKFFKYYNLSTNYMDVVMERMRNRFSKEEIEVIEKVLRITTEELMPELDGIKEIKI